MSFLNTNYILETLQNNVFVPATCQEQIDSSINFESQEDVFQLMLKHELIDANYKLNLSKIQFPTFSTLVKTKASFKEFINKKNDFCFFGADVAEDVAKILFKNVQKGSPEFIKITRFLHTVAGENFKARLSFKDILNFYLNQNKKVDHKQIQLYAGFFLYQFCQENEIFDNWVKDFFACNHLNLEGIFSPPQWRKRFEMDVKFFLDTKDEEELLTSNDLFLMSFVKLFGIQAEGEVLNYYRVLFLCFLKKSSKVYPNTVIGEKDHQLDILFVNEQKYLFATDQIAYSLLKKQTSLGFTELDEDHVSLVYPSDAKFFQALFNLYFEVDHIEGAVNDKVIPRIISRMSAGFIFPNRELQDVMDKTVKRMSYTELFLDYHVKHHDEDSQILLGFILNMYISLKQIGLANDSLEEVCFNLKRKINPEALRDFGLSVLFKYLEQHGFTDQLEFFLFWMAFFEQGCKVSIKQCSDNKYYRLKFSNNISVFIAYRSIEEVLFKCSFKEKNQFLGLFKQFFDTFSVNSASIAILRKENRLLSTLSSIVQQEKITPFDVFTVQQVCVLSEEPDLVNFSKKITTPENLKLDFALYFFSGTSFKEFIANLSDQDIKKHFQEIFLKLFSINKSQALNTVLDWFIKGYLEKSHLNYLLKFCKQDFETSKSFYTFIYRLIPFLKEKGIVNFFSENKVLASLVKMADDQNGDLIVYAHDQQQIETQIARALLADIFKNLSINPPGKFPLKIYQNFRQIDPKGAQVFFENFFKQDPLLFALFCQESFAESLVFISQQVEMDIRFADHLFGHIEYPLKSEWIDLLILIFDKYLTTKTDIRHYLRFQSFLAEVLRLNQKKGVELYDRVFARQLSRKNFIGLAQSAWKVISEVSFDAAIRFYEICIKYGKDTRKIYRFEITDEIQLVIVYPQKPEMVFTFSLIKPNLKENLKKVLNCIGKYHPLKAIELTMEALKQGFACLKIGFYMFQSFREILQKDEQLFVRFTNILFESMDKKHEQLFFEKKLNLLKEFLQNDLTNGVKFLEKALDHHQIQKETSDNLLVNVLPSTSRIPLSVYSLLFRDQKFDQQILVEVTKIFKENPRLFLEFNQSDEGLAYCFLNQSFSLSLLDISFFENLLELFKNSKKINKACLSLLLKFIKTNLLQHPSRTSWLDKYIDIFIGIYEVDFALAFELLVSLLPLKLLNRKNINVIVQRGGELLENGQWRDEDFPTVVQFLKWACEQNFALSYELIVNKIVAQFNHRSDFDSKLREFITILNFSKSSSSELTKYIEKKLEAPKIVDLSFLNNFFCYSEVITASAYNESFEKIICHFLNQKDFKGILDLILHSLELKKIKILNDFNKNLLKECVSGLNLEGCQIEKVLFHSEILFLFKNSYENFYKIIFSCFDREILSLSHAASFIEFLKKNKINAHPDLLLNFVVDCSLSQNKIISIELLHEILNAIFDYFKRFEFHKETIDLAVKLIENKHELEKYQKTILDALGSICSKSLNNENIIFYIGFIKVLTSKIEVNEQLIKSFHKILIYLVKDKKINVNLKILEFIQYIKACQTCLAFHKFCQLNEPILLEFKKIHEELLYMENCEALAFLSLVFTNLRNYICLDLEKQSKKLSEKTQSCILWIISNTEQNLLRNLEIFKHYNLRCLQALRFSLEKIEEDQLNSNLLFNFKSVFEINFILGKDQQKKFFDNLYICLNTLLRITPINEGALRILLKGINTYSIIVETFIIEKIQKIEEHKKVRRLLFREMQNKLDIDLLVQTFSLLDASEMGLSGYNTFTLDLIEKLHSYLQTNKSETFYSLACHKLANLTTQESIDYDNKERLYGRQSILEKILFLRADYPSNPSHQSFSFEKLIEASFNLKYLSALPLLKLINAYCPIDKIPQISHGLYSFITIQELERNEETENQLQTFFLNLMTLKDYTSVRLILNNYQLAYSFPELFAKIYLLLLRNTKYYLDFQGALDHFEIVLMNNLSNDGITNLWNELLDDFDNYAQLNKKTNQSTDFLIHLFKIISKGCYGPKVKREVEINFNYIKSSLPQGVSPDNYLYENLLHDRPIFSVKTFLYTKKMSQTVELYNYYFWLLLDGLSIYIHKNELKFPTSFIFSKNDLDQSVRDFDQNLFNKSFINFIKLVENQRGSLKEVFTCLIEKIVSLTLIEHQSKSHYLLIFLEAIIEYFIENRLPQEELRKLFYQLMHSPLLLRMEADSCLLQHLHFIEGMIKKIDLKQYPELFMNTLLFEHQLLVGIKTKSITLSESEILEKTKEHFITVSSYGQQFVDHYWLGYLENYLQVLKHDSALIEFLINEITDHLLRKNAKNLKIIYISLFEKVITKLEDSIFKNVMIYFWDHFMRIVFQESENLNEDDLHSMATLLSEKGLLVKLKGKDFLELLERMLVCFMKYSKEQTINKNDWKTLFNDLIKNLSFKELVALEQKIIHLHTSAQKLE